MLTIQSPSEEIINQVLTIRFALDVIQLELFKKSLTRSIVGPSNKLWTAQFTLKVIELNQARKL